MPKSDVIVLNGSNFGASDCSHRLINELQTLPYSGDPKELVHQLDKIKAKDDILQLKLPNDMYSACALKALGTVNEELVNYLRSSIDLSDYANLRKHLQRMRSSKTMTKQEPRDPLMAMMAQMMSKMPRDTRKKQPTLSWKPGMGKCKHCDGNHLHKDCKKVTQGYNGVPMWKPPPETLLAPDPPSRELAYG